MWILLKYFQESLNTVVLKDMRSNKDNVRSAVLAVEYCHKESKKFLIISLGVFYLSMKLSF
jgi:hypothetical protein